MNRFAFGVSSLLRYSCLALILLLGIFSLILYRQNISNLSKKKASEAIKLSQSRLPENVGIPVRIKIPKIHLDAVIQQVGFSKDGAMDVPTNSVDVGWFKLGPKPGEKGSAVIDGHLDAINGVQGVFYNLHQLIRGDKIYIEDGKGTSIAFIVRMSRTYDPNEDVPDVFNKTDGNYLNLITCDGVWDKGQKSYSKRLVVFTDRMK